MAGVFKSLRYEGDLVTLTYQAKGMINALKLSPPGCHRCRWRPLGCRAEFLTLANAVGIGLSRDHPGAEIKIGSLRLTRDVWYQGRLSPDFYAWVFPMGATPVARRGRAGTSLKASVAALREDVGLSEATAKRKEGAPIP